MHDYLFVLISARKIYDGVFWFFHYRFRGLIQAEVNQLFLYLAIRFWSIFIVLLLFFKLPRMMIMPSFIKSAGF